MMPTIHVAVTAWRRPNELARTLESFRALNGARTGACPYNGDDNFRLWYGTDGGADPQVHAVAASFGFTYAGESKDHLGIAATTRNLLHAILQKAEDDDLVLLLQEDWESVRPVPLRAVGQCLDVLKADVVRQFGRNKQARPDQPLPVSDSCLVEGYPDTKWRDWTVASEAVLCGLSYWSFPPTIIRLWQALELLQGARREMDVIRHSLERGYKVAWLMDPVMYHIGFTGWKKMGGKR